MLHFVHVPLQVVYTDKSVVATAPTGSGKTVIFELAIIRLLTKMENNGLCGKIVYSKCVFACLCSQQKHSTFCCLITLSG